MWSESVQKIFDEQMKERKELDELMRIIDGAFIYMLLGETHSHKNPQKKGRAL